MAGNKHMCRLGASVMLLMGREISHDLWNAVI